MDQEKAISMGSTQDSRISANEIVDPVNLQYGLTCTETVSEAMIKISIHEDRESRGIISISEEDEKSNVEDRCSSCVIDVKIDERLMDEDEESQRVCRICHLSAWESCKSLVDLIQIGCGCKGELGFAHSHCAEAWFKIKGNRICEICGESAKNITGVVDNKFMEEWNENRSASSGVSGSSEMNRGCWQGQPLCNFLMACLVIAFVLPWFFRVNMF